MTLTYIRSNIKRLRKVSGITQREMAERLFMDERTYAKMERGTNKSMDVRLLSSIAEILRTDVAALMQPLQEEKKNSTAGGDQRGAGHQDLVNEVRELKEEVRELIDFQKKALQLLSLATSTNS